MDIHELEEQAKTQAKTIESLTEENKAQKDLLTEAESNVATLNTQAAQAKKDLEAAQADLKTSQEKVTELEQENAKLKEDLKASQEKVAELEQTEESAERKAARIARNAGVADPVPTGDKQEHSHSVDPELKGLKKAIAARKAKVAKRGK